MVGYGAQLRSSAGEGREEGGGGGGWDDMSACTGGYIPVSMAMAMATAAGMAFHWEGRD